MDESAYSAPDSDLTIDYSSDENFKLWKANAQMMANNGRSTLSVQQFLISKGLSKDHARAAAVDLTEEETKKRKRLQLPFKITGWFLILSGTLSVIPFLFFAMGGLLLSAFFIAVGSWLVFKVCSKRGVTLDI